MMAQESEESFTGAWDRFCEKWKAAYPKVIIHLEKNFLDDFQKHSSIWRLKELNVYNPKLLGNVFLSLRSKFCLGSFKLGGSVYMLGLTNNAAESINNVLKSLNSWKEIPVDVAVCSLWHLSR